MINLYDLIQLYLLYCDKEKHLSKHTIKAYRIDLIQFCSYKDDMSISKDDLILYIRHLHETFKPKTIRRKDAFCQLNIDQRINSAYLKVCKISSIMSYTFSTVFE